MVSGSTPLLRSHTDLDGIDGWTEVVSTTTEWTIGSNPTNGAGDGLGTLDGVCTHGA